MENSDQYNIPYDDIPRGIVLSLINSDRHRIHSEILAKKGYYNSAIPLITLAVEEFGKALWLSEYFEKNESIPHKEGSRIFSRHKPKIEKVLVYVKDTVKQRTMATRINRDSKAATSFHIPEEFDDQDFKKRMWYVDYQKTQDTEFSWKKQSSWKNPLYMGELNFGGEQNAEFGTLYYKYHDLWRCAFHGISKFRRGSLYNKILNVLPSEEFSFERMCSYIRKHFLLEGFPPSIIYDKKIMNITAAQSWITPILADIIKKHVQKKYHVKQVHINVEPY